MPPSNPRLRIEINVVNDEIVIAFKKPHGRGDLNALTVRTGMSPRALGEAITSYYKGLDRFLKHILTKSNGLDVKDFSIVEEALRILYEYGNRLSFRLFRSDDKFHDVIDLFQTMCPNWRLSSAPDYDPPSIQIVAQLDHILPFEFLPLLDNRDFPQLCNVTQLSEQAARFLGYATNITRVARHSAFQTATPELDNDPKLRMRFFQYAGLRCAREERNTFQKAEWIDFRGPWPDKLLPKDQFLSDLALQLYNATDSSRSTEPQSLDQIQHFACHCKTDVSPSTDYELTLSSPHLISKISERRVTIGELSDKFARYSRRDPNANPLVFLNACGTSTLTPLGTTSFPQLFLSIGNRGVIGTEAPIPDRCAAAFSKEFYLQLIRGKSLGEAIFHARWWLLTNNNKYNPLGILYTVYANPDLVVNHKMPRATLIP
jgi:hypothetical protein